MRTEGTNVLFLTISAFWSSSRCPWPPRWAPEGREVSHLVVVIDRFHCSPKTANVRRRPSLLKNFPPNKNRGNFLFFQAHLKKVISANRLHMIHKMSCPCWNLELFDCYMPNYSQINFSSNLSLDEKSLIECLLVWHNSSSIREWLSFWELAR